MKEKDEWIPYKELEWNDEKFNVFSIDTRDFHAGYRFEKSPHKDYDKISKYPDFFHTEEEIKSLIDRYYNESGGEAEWRFFMIKGIDNWGMKYIRIWRTEKGFIVCDSDNRAFRKELLATEVDKEHL